MLTLENFILVVGDDGKIERVETDKQGAHVPAALYKEADQKGLVLITSGNRLIRATTKQRFEELLD